MKHNCLSVVYKMAYLQVPGLTGKKNQKTTTRHILSDNFDLNQRASCSSQQTDWKIPIISFVNAVIIMLFYEITGHY